MSLTSADIAHLVAELLDQYRYESVAPSTTFGAPWTAEKEAGYVELLKQCLVLPRLESFVLAETYEQVTAGTRDRAEYRLFPRALIMLNGTTQIRMNLI